MVTRLLNMFVTYIVCLLSVVFLAKRFNWDLGTVSVCCVCHLAEFHSLTMNKLHTVHQLTDISGRWSPVDGGYALCTLP